VPVLYFLTEHHAVKAYWALLTSALDGAEWSASSSGRFIRRERAPGTHCIGVWVGPRAVLYAVMA
jgi:hypothetical protein